MDAMGNQRKIEGKRSKFEKVPYRVTFYKTKKALWFGIKIGSGEKLCVKLPTRKYKRGGLMHKFQGKHHLGI